MGAFSLQVHRDGELVLEEAIPNRWFTVATDLLLNVLFRAATPPSFYLGLIGDQGWTSGLSDSDTMASHPGWVEFGNYTQYPGTAPITALRPVGTLQGGTPTSYPGSPPVRGAIGSDAEVGFQFAFGGSTGTQFIVNTTGRLRGLFWCTDSTIGGTTGTLLAHAVFPSAFTFELRVGDTMTVIYDHRLKIVLDQIFETI